jgi:tetratricopeptide (TPR) repeat protein
MAPPPGPRDVPLNRQQRRAEMKKNGAVRHAASPAPEDLFQAALEHYQAGCFGDAARPLRQILKTYPRHAGSLHMLGLAEQRMGHLESAIELIGKAIALDERNAPYHFNLSRALEDAGRLAEAARSYRRTLTFWPDNPDAHVNLGCVLQELGQLEDAAACFRKAIQLEPGFAEAQTNLGSALRDIGQLEEALICGRRAVELAPNLPAAHVNLGATLERHGRLDEAMACYRHALGLQPGLPAAHNNLALALLAKGDMEAGWNEYEWRWRMPKMRAEQRRFAQPQWRGEAAEGKTLLIHAEQGFGDTLQFCRYATHAAARGLRVIMLVQAPLVRLLGGVEGVALVAGRGDKPPKFDMHVPMLSLPRIFGTALDTIPNAGAYLHADETMEAAWRARLATLGCQGRRIGLVWAGSPSLAADRQRSISAEYLAPLLEVPGCDFFSLQKTGPAAPAGFALHDFMGEMDDFASTAALIANLDLVIAADTAVAHLAAALGKPVWLMDRFAPCWRWLTGRTDSPWYPTLRIYRQPRPDDWAPVIAAIVSDLKEGACK